MLFIVSFLIAFAAAAGGVLDCKSTAATACKTRCNSCLLTGMGGTCANAAYIGCTDSTGTACALSTCLATCGMYAACEADCSSAAATACVSRCKSCLPTAQGGTCANPDDGSCKDSAGAECATCLICVNYQLCTSTAGSSGTTKAAVVYSTTTCTNAKATEFEAKRLLISGNPFNFVSYNKDANCNTKDNCNCVKYLDSKGFNFKPYDCNTIGSTGVDFKDKNILKMCMETCNTDKKNKCDGTGSSAAAFALFVFGIFAFLF